MIDHEKIQKLIILMVDGARPSANASDIVEGICTKRSNIMSAPELIEILNTSFDALVPHVDENGEEILKFLGDGFFAIFPFDSKDEAKTAAV